MTTEACMKPNGKHRPIYLDYAATTPVDPEVAAAMNQCLTHTGHFGNPASHSHWYGWQAEEVVEEARQLLADLVHCDAREIVWTSGATEANNLAIKGMLEANPGRGRHLLTSMVEHMAVLDPIAWLERRFGYAVTRLQPDARGCLTPEQVQAALRPDTALVSLMHVNNEIGTINPIDAIGAVTRQAGVPLHVDAAQSLGKLPLDLSTLPVELMSFSAHKIYGPKGAGALYVRRSAGLPIAAQTQGGGHERNMRSGTLATHQIAGMGRAAQICGTDKAIRIELERVGRLRALLLGGLEGVQQCHVNGTDDGYPGILNIAFPVVEGETLLMALAPHLAASSGSACTSIRVEPSHVLLAMGCDERYAHSSLRFSFGRFTTEGDIKQAAQHLRQTLLALA